jgi:predicted nucleic acid-binding protein
VSAYILDASVVASLYLEDSISTPASTAIGRLYDEDARFHAPELLLHEVSNVILKVARRDGLTAADCLERIEGLRRSDVQLHAAAALAAPALTIALAHGLTAYDAAYLALAIGIGATLLTADRGLAAGATGAGAAVQLIEPA